MVVLICWENLFVGACYKSEKQNVLVLLESGTLFCVGCIRLKHNCKMTLFSWEEEETCQRTVLHFSECILSEIYLDCHPRFRVWRGLIEHLHDLPVLCRGK